MQQPTPDCVSRRLALTTTAVAGPTATTSANATGREQHVMVPMRDGTRLSMRLHFPDTAKHGQGPWPAIFEQRYGNDGTDDATRADLTELADGGFVVGLLMFRGAWRSEGEWLSYRALGWGEHIDDGIFADGYDACEWLASQPWCTGKVGTFGSSQAGFAQNFLAVMRPPSLVCQYMIDTGLSLYHEAYRMGGCCGQHTSVNATAAAGKNGIGRGTYGKDHSVMTQKEWEDHTEHCDDYWLAEDCTRYINRMDVPCCTVGSWYDFMCQGSIASFVGRQHLGGACSRGQQQLIIGPWLHGRYNKGSQVGELTYPAHAAFPIKRNMIEYFTHHLLRKPRLSQLVPVQYYRMGAVDEPDALGNDWHEASDWPVPASPTAFYLTSGGLLSSVPGQVGTSPVCADPSDPADTGTGSSGFAGARDARPFETSGAAGSVLTFTSDVLTEPVEWTGAVRARLFVAVDGDDADFIARVSDVYPDGRSILIADHPRRVSLRYSLNEPPLPPEPVNSLDFRIGWMSQVFNAGHRIRVTIACTGGPLWETVDAARRATRVATHRLLHGPNQASHVLAPVVGTGGASQDTSFRAELATGIFPK
jgi:predicted acyl esterase